MKKTIILISGKSNSGKDTLATYIYITNTKCGLYAFANPLKDISIDLFDIPKHCFYTQSGKSSMCSINGFENQTNRDWLIHSGFIFKNYFGEDIFVKSTLDQIKKHENNISIISDLRLKSELDIVKKFCNDNNYKLITIRINSIRSKYINTETETNLDDYKNFDITINNNGTIDELHKTFECQFKKLT